MCIRDSRSYVTNFIVQETIDNYKYMQLNDYLLGAMSLVDSVMDIQFPPQNYIRIDVYKRQGVPLLPLTWLRVTCVSSAIS